MAGTQQSQEDLQKQNQINQEMQQQYRKMCMLQQAIGVIRSLDKKSVLDTLSKQVGPNIYCPNMMISQQLTQKIVTLLNDTPELDEHAVKIQQILLNAISLTSAIRTNLMYSQGMSGMGGMGMQQFGMNPMMGMGMNPMGGMPGMMGGFGMGMGMPGMMGGFGMSQFGFNQFQQQPQNTQTAEGVDEATRKIQIAKEYVKTQAFQADPLIFLSMLSNQLGLNIDFSTDPQFEELIVQALSCAIQQMCMTNPMIFQSVYYVIQQMYMTDYYTKLNNGKGGNQQPNQFNPMMMGIGMNPMMGGFGMGMGMPGMMGGMMTGMDQNAMMGMGMNPMMGMGMPNMMGPMMGGMNMMPGMTGTMGMPGMNNGSVGGTGGCIW